MTDNKKMIIYKGMMILLSNTLSFVVEFDWGFGVEFNTTAVNVLFEPFKYILNTFDIVSLFIT